MGIYFCFQGSNIGSNNGWIELVIIEAKDLVAADIGGTSDPYVRVQYGNLKKRTKVWETKYIICNCYVSGWPSGLFCLFSIFIFILMLSQSITFCWWYVLQVMFKTLNPHWNQTLEFPDDGSPLLLHVKDHNALLPTSSIGDCVVEYQRLPPNQMADKWIPLQGVKRGEIHIQITRKVPDLEKEKRVSLDSRPTSDSELSVTKAHQVSSQVIYFTWLGIVNFLLWQFNKVFHPVTSLNLIREQYHDIEYITFGLLVSKSWIWYILSEVPSLTNGFIENNWSMLSKGKFFH